MIIAIVTIEVNAEIIAIGQTIVTMMDLVMNIGTETISCLIVVAIIMIAEMTDILIVMIDIPEKDITGAMIDVQEMKIMFTAGEKVTIMKIVTGAIPRGVVIQETHHLCETDKITKMT